VAFWVADILAIVAMAVLLMGNHSQPQIPENIG